MDLSLYMMGDQDMGAWWRTWGCGRGHGGVVVDMGVWLCTWGCGGGLTVMSRVAEISSSSCDSCFSLR